MSWLLLCAALLPTALAAGLAIRPLRPVAGALAPWAALPALALALTAPVLEAVPIPWLLLEARVGLDVPGQAFLLLTAILWTVAGVYARAYHAEDPRRTGFFVAFLLTMTGNLMLVIAQDGVTFYSAFAIMTFAAYPLVLHAGDSEARRAGRVYIALAVLGETLLVAGLIITALASASLAVEDMAAGLAMSPHRTLGIGLLLAGFGVKAGALPLHIWLPLAHPVAPTAASAVLSGCMIKAGLLGWIRFLPLGEAQLAGWGALVIGLGLAAAFFGVLIGVTQTDPKTALAYSSISQMGLINVAIGVGLARPEGWGAALSASLTYSVHHGLAKGALFLGVGVAAAATTRKARYLVMAGLGMAALALAGAPLTSGSVAKTYLKEIAPLSPAAWPQLLDVLLPLTAVGTTLLMARFLWLVSRPATKPIHHELTVDLWLPWAVLLVAVGFVLWWLPGAYELELDPPGLPYPGAIWVAIWPLIVGGILAWTVLLLTRRLRLEPGRFQIAAGDLLLLIEWGLARIPPGIRRGADHAPADPVSSISSQWYGIYAHGEGRAAVALERRITAWTTAGTLAVLIAVALLFFLVLG